MIRREWHQPSQLFEEGRCDLSRIAVKEPTVHHPMPNRDERGLAQGRFDVINYALRHGSMIADLDRPPRQGGRLGVEREEGELHA